MARKKEEPVVPPSTFVAPSREDLMEDVQGAILRAFEARREYIREEADTVTLASIRRILEKDLNVEGGFLGPHKELLTGLIKELMQGPEERSPETQETGKAVDETHVKGKEPEAPAESDEVADQKPRLKRLKKKADDSEAIPKDESPADNTPEDDELPSLSDPKAEIATKIWEAAHKRASQFKSQAETLTVKGVRRLLEQDLELEKGFLDSYKDQIRAALDEILNSENAGNPESPGNAEDEEPVDTEVVPKPKRRKAGAPENMSKAGKKRKSASAEEVEESAEEEGAPKMRKGGNSHKSSKKKVMQEEDEDEDEEDEEPNEKGRSSAEELSDDEKTERKKVLKSKPVESSKFAYGKKVEHLRSIIKECGITVPPSVYKKAKQAGASRRESIMIMELEAILRKEGLTGTAAKDEIKVVRKRKEKLKDLEGIDTSNIIEEPRGRRSRASANSFFTPRHDDPIDLGDEDEDENEDSDGDDNSEGDPNVELQDDDDDED